MLEMEPVDCSGHVKSGARHQLSSTSFHIPDLNSRKKALSESLFQQAGKNSAFWVEHHYLQVMSMFSILTLQKFLTKRFVAELIK